MEARTRTQENDREFRPHMRHVEVLTKHEPDWKSCLRWIPEPRYSDAPFPEIKFIKFPAETKLMRSFPQANVVSQSEWTFYPNFGQPVTYHVGKRSFIGRMQSGDRFSSEQTLEVSMGKKKQVNPRCRSASDSSFLIPEYSPHFHKLGSTLPKSNFGYPTVTKADTFIPLQPLPEKLGIPYAKKKKILEQEEEISEVKSLTTWRPAARIFKQNITQHKSSQTL